MFDIFLIDLARAILHVLYNSGYTIAYILRTFSGGVTDIHRIPRNIRWRFSA